MSERKPTSARSGAKTSGRETMTATSHVGTPSSTTMTRLSVPFSSTTAMPMETWNSASRSRRPSGSSGVAASAKGRKRGVRYVQTRETLAMGHQLQRLGGVEAAGDPLGPRRFPAVKPGQQMARARLRAPARSRGRGRRAGTACRPRASTASALVRGAKVKTTDDPVRSVRSSSARTMSPAL